MIEHERDVVPLMRQQMAAAEAQMRRTLDQILFTPIGGAYTAPVWTWKDRLRWKIQRVQTYFVTIWRALRGDALDSPFDDDDD